MGIATAASIMELLLYASASGSILAAAILLIRALAGRILTASSRHLLWLLLLSRLLLPMDISNPASFYSLIGFPAPPRPAPIAESFHPAEGRSPEDRSPGEARRSTPVTARVAPTRFPSRLGNRIVCLAGILWAAGIALLAGASLARRLRFRAALRGAARVGDMEISGAMAKAVAAMRIGKKVELLESPLVGGPFLIGFIRPKIFLPSGFSRSHSADELEYVLCHELAHVKRLDLLANALASLARILHWWNPLLRLALRKMREDAEAACDELVLLRLGEGQKKAYGRLLISMAESAQGSMRLPGAVAIFENRSSLKRRIAVISRFKGKRRGGSLVASSLMAFIGFFFLTNAPNLTAEDILKSAGHVMIDDIDLPFVDDPAVIGRWKSVDFVWRIEDFKPGSRYTEGHLYSKELRFKEGGAFGVAADDVDTDDAFWYAWTKGVLMHSGDHTAARYVIDEIDGSSYLFLEWKSGDYFIRGAKPWYYVYTFEG